MTIDIASAKNLLPFVNEQEKQLRSEINLLMERVDLKQDQNLEDLIRIAVAALAFWPPFYVQSIFGKIYEWVLPKRRYSEFNIIDIWRPVRTLDWVRDVTVPSFPWLGPNFLPPLVQDSFWRPTTIYQQPDHNQNYCSFLNEAWFFINGVATNESVARMNSSLLANLFHRPMTVIQNATNSLALDLFQCVLGKGWGVQTEPAVKALPPIIAALNNPKKEKVVVVCHSQGTIIMSNVLRALLDESFKHHLYELYYKLNPKDCDELREPDGLLDPESIRKLEIYAFANCATTMTYSRYKTANGSHAPYIENYGNEYDLVARLGMLAPEKAEEKIHIDGYNYRYDDKWGHLLNQHYLFPMEAFMEKYSRYKSTDPEQNPYQPWGNEGEVPELPRLYGYYRGAEQGEY